MVPQFCVRPFKMNVAPRLGQSHVEVVNELYTLLSINDRSVSYAPR